MLDDVPLADEQWQVTSEVDCIDFINLLRDSKRKHPIVAVSSDTDGNCAPISRIVNHVIGAAHVVYINESSSWQITRTLGRQWSVFAGAVRVYWPGVDVETDNPRRHPLMLPHNFVDDDDIVNEISSVVLPRALFTPEGDGRLLRFDHIRASAAYKERRAEEHSLVKLSAAKQISNLETEITRLRNQIKEDQAAQEQLLTEESGKRSGVERDRDAAWAEAARLRERVWVLEEAQRSGLPSSDAAFDEWNDLEQWCGRVLAGSVVILPRALRECKKHGTHEIKDVFVKTLILLRDSYVPMRRNKTDRTEFDRSCERLNIDEGPPFHNMQQARSRPEYYCNYRSTRHLLDRHIRYGNGFDLRRMFRIYFFWDEEEGVIVIGHMPTHLDNNLTN